MIVRKGTTFARLFARHGWPFVPLVAASGLAEYIFLKTNRAPTVITLATAGLMMTALSIFLGFRMSEAYDRWWEARKLWGALVNASRSFARKVFVLVTTRRTGTESEALIVAARTELIHRHIVYVNALRVALRSGPRIGVNRKAWEEIRPLMRAEEWEAVQDAANVPTQLLKAQSEQLGRLFSSSPEAELAHLELQRTLDALYDVQGACERIKNTVFPDNVTFATRLMVWTFALTFPFAVLDADARADLLEIVAVASMSYVFVLIERIGHELKNPFENEPNDTPMTALSRTIEIDLRQMLEEADIPQPLLPERGVLM